MNIRHATTTFVCENEWLVAVITCPEAPGPRGVLVVVGGPQYRVGSHRQFKLLAESLAERGIPVMRFDCRGMGDSTGDTISFEHIASDMRCALDTFFGAVSELRDVVVWGLCDAASAALLHARFDGRISGLVLLNPWVRTAGSEARTYLRHYYFRRLMKPAAWRNLLRGGVDISRSAKSFAQYMRTAVGLKKDSGRAQFASHCAHTAPLPDRMAEGLENFKGRVLLILSGNDLTAREFIDVTAASKRWQHLLASDRITRHVLPGATHTFSRRQWRDQVATWTAEWICSW